MSRWARHPPPLSRVVFVLAIVAVGALLYGIEAIWGWPDWLTVDRARRPVIR